MCKNTTCLVTLHGIGFEQPPQDDKPNSGYADLLHQHLKKCLRDQLSDDPKRAWGREEPGNNGAIYVRSCWGDKTTGLPNRENGLQRLDDRLVAHHEPVSHIALVYSNLEPHRRNVKIGRMVAWMSLSSLWSYATPLGLAHMLLADTWAVTRHLPLRESGPVSSCPRTDRKGIRHPRFLSGLRSTMMNLEDDVGCYICDNEERERVRSFVAEALTRLASRTDVKRIILNTHSNGTVIAFDVLHTLPEAAAKKITVFVTAGSPLRKYVDLCSWGNQIQTSSSVEHWYNFFDPRDPVADPLVPSVSWRRGQKPAESEKETLFYCFDHSDNKVRSIHIVDRSVDNVKWTAGSGLRAHNYWDNEMQFVPQLAEIVHNVAICER